MATEARVLDRGAALDPYIAALMSLEVSETEYLVGNVDLDALGLDSWEKSILRDVVSGDEEQRHQWSDLLVSGVAFKAKYQEDYSQLSRGITGSLESQAKARRLLISDAAIGLSLMEETQRAIDAMVLAGEIVPAKKLSGFRNKLVQTVTAIKEKVGNDAFREAEEMAIEMTSPGPQRLPKSRSVPDLPTLDEELDRPEKTRWKPREYGPVVHVKTEMPGEEPRRTRLLIAVFAGVVALWMIVMLPRILGEERLPVITPQEMPTSSAIRDVLVRPPSLYVQVDATAWSRMEADERQALVAEIGQTAEASGYTGASLQDENGRAVARWLRKTGVDLLAP